MPLVSKKYENLLGESEWQQAYLVFFFMMGVIIYTWNPHSVLGTVYKVVMGILVLVSAGYMNYRLAYYAHCGKTFLTDAQKYDNEQFVWSEWQDGFRHLPHRIFSFWLFIVTSSVLIISKNGDLTAYAGIGVTVVFAIIQIARYENYVPKAPPENYPNNPDSLKKWDNKEKKAVKNHEAEKNAWGLFFTKIIFVQVMLLQVEKIRLPDAEISGLLFQHMWTGLLAVGVGFVAFWLAGRAFCMIMPFAMIPLWYAIECITGVSIIPLGLNGSGAERFLLPLFLFLTLLLESQAPIRRKFFETPADWSPIFEDMAKTVQYS